MIIADDVFWRDQCDCHFPNDPTIALLRTKYPYLVLYQHRWITEMAYAKGELVLNHLYQEFDLRRRKTIYDGNISPYYPGITRNGVVDWREISLYLTYAQPPFFYNNRQQDQKKVVNECSFASDISIDIYVLTLPDNICRYYIDCSESLHRSLVHYREMPEQPLPSVGEALGYPLQESFLGGVARSVALNCHTLFDYIDKALAMGYRVVD